MDQLFSDEYFMKAALAQAAEAEAKNEIPVGAVVVCQNRIVARGHNLTETLRDVTAHAEMQAITASAEYIGGKYLNQCTMYVTLEPCQMCAGALYWAQLGRLVYGADDPRRGYRAMGASLHPKTEVKRGVLADECETLINQFFARLRK